MDALSIRNWTRYQHYKDRKPPWVKLYVDILLDREYAALSVSSRLVGLLLLAVAANRDNLIPSDPSWIATELSVKRAEAKRALDDLLAINYLVPASSLASTDASNSASGFAPTLLAPRARPRARGEAEAETEAEREVLESDVSGCSNAPSPSGANNPDFDFKPPELRSIA